MVRVLRFPFGDRGYRGGYLRVARAAVAWRGSELASWRRLRARGVVRGSLARLAGIQGRGAKAVDVRHRRMVRLCCSNDALLTVKQDQYVWPLCSLPT